MSAKSSCWNCSHRIGGEHCPAERKKEAEQVERYRRIRGRRK